jgi:single-strand DNA-binding protein
MIKLTAIGHLGKDATSNNVSGKTVINFAVAHTEKYKNQQGEQVDKTIWIDCAWWTDKVAVLPYLKKGTQVYIEGQPEASKYESNGNVGVKLVCRIASVQLLGSKSDGQPTTTTAAPTPQAAATVDDDDTTLPF